VFVVSLFQLINSSQSLAAGTSGSFSGPAAFVVCGKPWITEGFQLLACPGFRRQPFSEANF
jgi:hypothetical protein